MRLIEAKSIFSTLNERILITRALAHTDGRRIEAANQLGGIGMGRNTLTRKIQELGIDD